MDWTYPRSHWLVIVLFGILFEFCYRLWRKKNSMIVLPRYVFNTTFPCDANFPSNRNRLNNHTSQQRCGDDDDDNDDDCYLLLLSLLWLLYFSGPNRRTYEWTWKWFRSVDKTEVREVFRLNPKNIDASISSETTKPISMRSTYRLSARVMIVCRTSIIKNIVSFHKLEHCKLANNHLI